MAVRALKGDGRRGTWLVEAPGGDARVRRIWPLDAAGAIKLVLGISQAQRQARGARATSRAGIDAPSVLAGPRRALHDGVRVIELEQAYMPGCDCLELLRRGDLDDGAVRDLARACGRLVAAYRAAGLFHRDLKLSNIVAPPGERGALAVVDTVGVRRARRSNIETVRMLDRLDVQLRGGGPAVPRAARVAALRAALGGLSRAQRRAVTTLLRRRPRR